MNCLVTEASWDGGPSSLLFRHIGILSSLGALPDISDHHSVCLRMLGLLMNLPPKYSPQNEVKLISSKYFPPPHTKIFILETLSIIFIVSRNLTRYLLGRRLPPRNVIGHKIRTITIFDSIYDFTICHKKINQFVLKVILNTLNNIMKLEKK